MLSIALAEKKKDNESKSQKESSKRKKEGNYSMLTYFVLQKLLKKLLNLPNLACVKAKLGRW